MCQYANLTYSKHVVTLHILSVYVITLVVKLPEEVEGDNSVEIHNDCQQTHSQDQLTEKQKIKTKQQNREEDSSEARTRLFPVVCNGRKDGTKRLEAHCNVQKVGSKKEVVVMTQR